MSEAYQIHILDTAKSHTSPSLLRNLSLRKVSKPFPGPGELLLRMRAVSLNYRDLLVLADSPLYPPVTVDGLVPCVDGVGEIEEIGGREEGRWNIGDGVVIFGFTLGSGVVDGLLQKYVVVKEQLCVRKPRNLSWEEAGSMYVSSRRLILENGGFTRKHADSESSQWRRGVDSHEGAGTTVLTQGTGGVSCFAVQVRRYLQWHSLSWRRRY